MSAAEELRAAARSMRERAQVVTPSAQWTGSHYWIEDYDPSDPSGQTSMQRLIGGMDSPDCDHYSSWHPPVALAVADWLDACAEFEAHLNHGSSASDEQRWRPHQYEQALTVARTYLGAT